jgi:ferric-dicitrate binding protein FerR (iron transport regulator)
MQNPSEYRKYAEECERMAKEGPQEHRAALLKIAEAWRNCAIEIEGGDKDAPSHKADGQSARRSELPLLIAWAGSPLANLKKGLARLMALAVKAPTFSAARLSVVLLS